jgi:hypothetical protein
MQDSTANLNELGYTLEQYDESLGIYYENKGQITLYNTEWSVVVYVNLEGINKQSDVIDPYIKHVSNLCQEIGVQNWTDCHHFEEIAHDKLRQVKKTEDLFADITNRKEGKTRRKRGLFNFIGEISKVLFGTLDNEDAEYYNEQIKHFEDNSDDITKLLKQQLVVVRSSLGTINNTITDMEYNEEKIKRGLIQIKNYLESVTAENKEKLNLITAKITVEGHIARIREATDMLQRHLDILLQSVISARRGILHPQIVSPKLIMDALIQSMPSFPKDTIPPFPLSKNSMNLIYKVCSMHVYINEGILGYVITFPLVNRGTFKVYRTIPVPLSLGNKKFAYIHTTESNLCLDQTRQYYFEMSNEELDNCKVMDSRTRICKQKQPLLSSHVQESCAVKLLQPRRIIPKTCDTRVVHISNTIWTQLDNNEWIYFTPTVDSVTILCTDKEPLEITLKGVGKVGLNAGCKGYSSFTLLQTSITVKAKSIKKEDILSRGQLDFDCLENLKLHFNSSKMPINLDFKHVVSHLDDLKHASYKMSELEKAIKEQEWKNHQVIKHSTYSVIVYILLTMIIIYVLYKIYRYIRFRFAPQRKLKALTAPQSEVETFTGRSENGNAVNINKKTSNESLSVGQEELPLQTKREEVTPRRSLRNKVAKSYF